MSIANINQHVVAEGSEASWTGRRHNIFEPLWQSALAKLELLENTESNLQVTNHVLTRSDVVLDVKLTANMRVALHINPVRNDEVVYNFGLPLVALVVKLLV